MGGPREGGGGRLRGRDEGRGEAKPSEGAQGGFAARYRTKRWGPDEFPHRAPFALLEGLLGFPL